MIYLLDASALISAHQTWYALSRVPEFWLWLRHHGEAGSIKMPLLIYNEVEHGRDDLAAWMKEPATRRALLLNESIDSAAVAQVMSRYGENLTESDLGVMGQDPFLIAAAIPDLAGRCVVSAEVSKPRKVGVNRHVPDVCADCNVACISPVSFISALDFTTSWDVFV